MIQPGIPPKRNVAIFLDMENLFGGYGRDVTVVPVGLIVAETERLVHASGVGSLTALVRAYANWGSADMVSYRKQLLENGVEAVQTFAHHPGAKNASDIELVVDALSVAAEHPWVDVYVIASGDGGFVPLVRRLQALGKYVIVVSTSHPDAGLLNVLLKSVADQFHEIKVPESAYIQMKLPPADIKTPGPVPATSKNPAKIQTAAKASTKDPAPAKEKVSVKVQPSSPTLEQYKATITMLVATDPRVLENGKVHGSHLGSILRQRWPSADYGSFGHGSLGAFLQAHFGLDVHRTHKTQASTAGPAGDK